MFFLNRYKNNFKFFFLVENLKFCLVILNIIYIQIKCCICYYFILSIFVGVNLSLEFRIVVEIINNL